MFCCFYISILCASVALSFLRVVVGFVWKYGSIVCTFLKDAVFRFLDVEVNVVDAIKCHLLLQSQTQSISVSNKIITSIAIEKVLNIRRDIAVTGVYRSYNSIESCLEIYTTLLQRLLG